ncbi:MAG: zinc-dependent metalloprotease family protein [Chitinophagales bacterium]|nr:T9SS type A sorting domain-containing protein [Bacteroidota bacterium]MCB9043724.1 T9SS type A sorting domain-containing protein [Chitinophagales bacterium]
MKKLPLPLLLCFLFASPLLFAQNNAANYWLPVDEAQIVNKGERRIIPERYKTYALDIENLQIALIGAPERFSENANNNAFEVSLPAPDGSFATFKIVESAVMPDKLAKQFDEIKTYSGWGVTDPYASIKLDITPHGFHAMILTIDKGSYFIDPYQTNDRENYLVYYKKDFLYKIDGNDFTCEFEDNIHGKVKDVNNDPNFTLKIPSDCNLRTYDLALACTGEYAAFHGGTVALALAAMNTTLNRVNGVYEKDLGITLVLVANNSSLVYINSSTDPYTNNNGSTMLGQNQTTCDNVIGNANYDIGHVFSTGGGGVAYLGCICNSSNKAGGVTGSSSPVGDPFDIDYVAHEMGHQFGGSHTFNATDGSCGGGNRTASAAYEPGSASTIMGYAGICGAADIQPHSDDYYHAYSLSQINTELLSSSCFVLSSNGNNAPTVNAGNNYTIPASTPFVLTATASDTDGDPISYCWEEMDLGSAITSPTATQTSGPNFRSFSPTASPSRYFPRLDDLVNNVSPTWEVLPSANRTLNFRVNARDNHAGLGCTDSDNMTVSVNNSAGPFLVTAPNTAVSWAAGSSQTVTWDVAGTTASPISCANVDILLSIDGGFTYPITLATNVPNDGSETITVPNNPSTTCRVFVRCSNNIFFDISNQNFTITAPTTPDFALSANPTAVAICAGGTATYNITISSLAGFSGNVTLSNSSLPTGVNGSFSPNPATSNSVFTLVSTGSTPEGVYTITITGTSGALAHTTDIIYEVVAAVTATTLSSPSNGATNQAIGTTLSWSSIANAATYTLEIATDAAFTNIIETQSGLTNNSTTANNLAPNTQYYWRVTAINACGSAVSSVFNFTTSAATYCYPTGNTQDEYIDNVTFASINNTSGNNNGYADFTNISANVVIGDTYNFSLTPAFTGQTWNEYWAIYIDFNGDGDFDDSGENIFTLTTSSNTTVSGAYTIPTVAPISTRMRVKMSYYSNELGACTNMQYGEYEDYTVVITQAGSCNEFSTETTTYTSGSGVVLVETWNYITANNTVDVGATVTYSAGEYIDLLPNFNAVSGADFLAKIEGCSAAKTDLAAKEIPAQNQLTIVPNPTSDGEINLLLHIQQTDYFLINLYDIQGKLLQNIYQGDLTSSKQTLAVSLGHLQKGIYLIQLQDNKGNSQIEKLIIL